MHSYSKTLYVFLFVFAVIFIFTDCERRKVSQTTKTTQEEGMHRFVVLDPGHFHAALVFKRPGYEGVSNNSAIYAPVGDDFTDHIARVVPFNTRKENPASWQYQIYLGPDFQERMMSEKFGDIAVLSGQNNLKIDRILACIRAGFNVLADKPLVIDPEKFPVLETALSEAEKNGKILLDLMTERYEITSIMQKVIVAEEPIFGKAIPGTPEDPSVVKKSVHHFYKLVAGRVNKRPWWYFDTNVQGEGLVDVTTHLVDLCFLILFPERPIDYKKDVKVLSATHWATLIEKNQFENVTGYSEFPSQFKLDKNGKYPCYANGEFTFTIDNIHCKASVEWRYEAPQGGGDTHTSIIKGTKANVIILQEKEQKYIPELYIETAPGADKKAVGEALTSFINKLANGDYPGVSVSQEGKYWKVNIPDKYRIGHEAHFGQVTDAFLGYLAGKPFPKWEKSNLLAKYYLTTQALKICQK
jgi:predicted dehydrogenase